jgi:hypothetical protein
MKKLICTTLTFLALAVPAVSHAWWYPMPVQYPGYMPVPVATCCVTAQGVWPMAVAVPVGSSCEAVTSWGVFYGVAQ